MGMSYDDLCHMHVGHNDALEVIRGTVGRESAAYPNVSGPSSDSETN